MERDFSKLDPKYLKYLSFDYKKDRIERLKKAVMTNQKVLSKIVNEYQSLFEYDKLPNSGMIAMKPMYIKPTDIIKMRSTIKSFLRDWSTNVLSKIRSNRYLFRDKKREICAMVRSWMRSRVISRSLKTRKQVRE